MDINREIIYKYLYQGKFDELSVLCEEMPREKIKIEFYNCASDDENIGIYFFTEYMALKTCDEFWNNLSSMIIGNALCHLEGAYAIVAFKARKMLEKEKSIKNLENFLMQYRWPDCDIEPEEAKQVAEDLLEIDPQNRLAKEILNS